MLKLQKTLVLLFLVTTLALNSVLLYSLNLYFGTYTAVRGFEIEMLRVRFQMPNGTYAEVELDIGFRNPSTYTLIVHNIAQRLFVNEEYLMYVTTNGSKGTPLVILPPSSSFNLSIVKPIPSGELERFTEPDNRTWISSTLVSLEAPLIGTIPIRYLLMSQEATTAAKTPKGMLDSAS